MAEGLSIRAQSAAEPLQNVRRCRRRPDPMSTVSAKSARHVHLVGSVPMRDAREVFETLSAALGQRLRRIPDGETGKRLDWITWLEPLFADHSAFEQSGSKFRLHAGVEGRT